MKAHKQLGSGFQEVIYQRALEMGFQKIGLIFSREHEMPVIYDGEEIGARRVDFLVNDKIMVELKAVSSLDDSHAAASSPAFSGSAGASVAPSTARSVTRWLQNVLPLPSLALVRVVAT